jgi:hypothetical protein
MRKQIIHLDELVGKHQLSGLDRYAVENEDSERDENIFRFVLDGITYTIKEDRDDGYRSFAGDLTVSNEDVKFKFPPQPVVAKISKKDKNGKKFVLDFYDAVTKKIVLSIGTVYYDSYYPCCCMEWHPENLFINQSAATQNQSI